MLQYIQLKKQIEKLQREAEVVRRRDRCETIKKIKEAIVAFELTAEDLGLSRAVNNRLDPKSTGSLRRRASHKKNHSIAIKQPVPMPLKGTEHELLGSDKRRVVAPKYRDSATGMTWSGRGKQPKWIEAAIKAGGNLEDLKI